MSGGAATDAADALLAKLRARLGPEASAVETYATSSDGLEVRFVSGKVKGASARESSGVAARAIRGGRLGFAGARDPSPRGLERLCEHVEDALGVGDASDLALPGPGPAPADEAALGAWDDATAGLGVADLVALGEAVLGPLRARFPGVVFDASVRRSVVHARLRNHAGVDVTWRATAVSVGVEANRTREDDVLLTWESAATPGRAALDPAAVVEAVARRLAWAERTVQAPSGRLPVLFTPAGGVLLWSPLLQALGGKTVMLGTSPLRERVGERVLDPRVRLVDDGLRPGALGSSPFDDEGTPRATRALIDGGTLTGFVHDLETARATGQAPTGNGERPGVLGRPGPGFGHVAVDGGDRPWEDLLRSIDRGLLVHTVTGMGQGNTLPGTFSNPLDLAYLVEGGQVVGRVKDVSIAGNVYDLLGPEHLAGLSAAPEPVGGGYHLPWVLVRDLRCVSKAG